MREYPVPHSARLRVADGDVVSAGDALTEGSMNPKDLLQIKGVDTVQRFLVGEVQKVYRSQGVTISDKHIEIIVRQMLRKVTVDNAGDTELLPSELIDRFEFEETNNRILAEGGEPATAQTVLLGVTKASLNTSSFLAAASFQETTRVLTEAAINGAKDHLIGLKENVIIGKLIPAGTGAEARRLQAERAAQLSPADEEQQREEAAARAFLSGDPDADGDGEVETDEAEAAAAEAGDTVADLMDAGSNPEMESAVEEAVFDVLTEEPRPSRKRRRRRRRPRSSRPFSNRSRRAARVAALRRSVGVPRTIGRAMAVRGCGCKGHWPSVALAGNGRRTADSATRSWPLRAPAAATTANALDSTLQRARTGCRRWPSTRHAPLSFDTPRVFPILRDRCPACGTPSCVPDWSPTGTLDEPKNRRLNRFAVGVHR